MLLAVKVLTGYRTNFKVMIHSDQHLNWLRSLEKGDLIGLSYFNGIQPGIIQRIRKGGCKVWSWKKSRPGYPYKTDIVENLPYEVDWIPVCRIAYPIYPIVSDRFYIILS